MAKDFLKIVFSGTPSPAVTDDLWILDEPIRPLDTVPHYVEAEISQMTADKRRRLFRIVKKAS